MSKAQRQHQITQLLADTAVGSQTRLVEMLEERNITATQATVSRDLDELGAVKVRLPGGESVYAIPEHPADRMVPEDHLRRVMGEWVVEVVASGNMVVMRTPPGSAHVVASALDRSSMPEIAGTVAGDDTLLIVAQADTTGQAVAEHLRQIAGL